MCLNFLVHEILASSFQDVHIARFDIVSHNKFLETFGQCGNLLGRNLNLTSTFSSYYKKDIFVKTEIKIYKRTHWLGNSNKMEN